MREVEGDNEVLGCFGCLGCAVGWTGAREDGEGGRRKKIGVRQKRVGARECLRKIAFTLHYRDSRSRHAGLEIDVLRKRTRGPVGICDEGDDWRRAGGTPRTARSL